jgi:hypothetical protein
MAPGGARGERGSAEGLAGGAGPAIGQHVPPPCRNEIAIRSP